jgi:hypothetical protein
MNPALAARVRQLAAQAEHRRAIAEFHARHTADQQGHLDALLLEAIDALASLLGTPTHHPRGTRVCFLALEAARHSSATDRATSRSQRLHRPAVHAKPCRHVNTESRRIMCKQRGR